MKARQPLFAALLAVGLCTLWGCRPDIDKDQCIANTDCNFGQVCASGICVASGDNNANQMTNNVVNNTTGTNNVVNNTTGTNNVVNNTTGTNNMVNPGACISIEPADLVDFGTATTGNSTTSTVLIENCSREVDLRISDIAICQTIDQNCSTPGVFQLIGLPDGLPGQPAIIAPGDTVNAVLAFTPGAAQAYEGLLAVRSNDPAAPEYIIPLEGVGTDGACPTAVAGVRVSGQTTYSTEVNTTPLKTVEFSAANSVPIDGAIDRYQWTIVERPANSTTQLTPSATVSNPTMFLDLAGRYVLELKVVDNDISDCGERATVTINALPDEDLHVQLVWDTPADPDQTDVNGTDFDLHFLHPTGTWNVDPYDCFWRNPAPDWGTMNVNSDDPSLDIDDTDGAGPENMNYDAPETGVYSVGAHYYAENGFGPSYATVRVYVDGQLEYEFRDKFMENQGSFWHAADVSWPGKTVDSVDTVTSAIPTN